MKTFTLGFTRGFSLSIHVHPSVPISQFLFFLFLRNENRNFAASANPGPRGSERMGEKKIGIETKNKDSLLKFRSWRQKHKNQ